MSGATAEALLRFAEGYLEAVGRPDPGADVEDAFVRLAALTAAQDAERPVDVEREVPQLPPQVRAWMKGQLAWWRAERIRSGTATARDYAVAFLATLERDAPDWTLAEWACALDAAFVLVALFEGRPVKATATHATMRWQAARIDVRVELGTGLWVARRLDAQHDRPEAQGDSYGSLAGWRWGCKPAAALIRLAKRIAMGRAR